MPKRTTIPFKQIPIGVSFIHRCAMFTKVSKAMVIPVNLFPGGKINKIRFKQTEEVEWFAYIKFKGSDGSQMTLS